MRYSPGCRLKHDIFLAMKTMRVRVLMDYLIFAERISVKACHVRNSGNVKMVAEDNKELR